MSSDNFPTYFAQYRFDKEQNVYKFKRISREHACEWKRFVMAAVHHKKMNTPVIGKPIMPREARKAAQKLSDGLITQEQILQAVRRMEEAYRKPPKDHYVLVYPPKVVELAKRQPDYEPLETYIEKIDKPYNGEVGRLRVLGRRQGSGVGKGRESCSQDSGGEACDVSGGKGGDHMNPNEGAKSRRPGTLLQCPFCGGEDLWVQIKAWPRFVKCQNCRAEVSSDAQGDDGILDVFKKWNRRDGM